MHVTCGHLHQCESAAFRKWPASHVLCDATPQTYSPPPEVDSRSPKALYQPTQAAQFRVSYEYLSPGENLAGI